MLEYVGQNRLLPRFLGRVEVLPTLQFHNYFPQYLSGVATLLSPGTIQ
jgi:hypothetical protein